MTFDNYNGSQSRVSASLRRYVSKFEEMRNRGLGFVLQGDKGNGKTFLAACVANALLDRYRVKFTSISALAPGTYGRIADRIIERCPVIKMGGESIRKSVAQENLAIMRDIMAEP